MAQQQTFRTALNGFNREDVVHYIEYLNSVHTAEINQLQSELEFLRNRQPVAETIVVPAAPASSDNNVVIEQQASRIRELFDQCKALEEKLAAAEEKAAHAEEKLQAVLTQQSTIQSRAGEELEAYRRAERIERIAKERAEQLYHQSNGALAEASVKVDDAAQQIAKMSDLVLAQLNLLQEAVSGTKVAMKEAAQVMYAIRPEEK